MSDHIILLTNQGDEHHYCQRLWDKTAFSVLHAHSVGEALMLISTTNPALLIVEAPIAADTVFSAFSRLRTTAAARALPFIILQNNSFQPSAETCYQAGADKVFGPHHSCSHIHAYIDRMMRRHALSVQLSDAWEIAVNHINDLSQSTLIKDPMTITLIGEETALRRRWAQRIAALLPLEVRQISADQAAEEILFAPPTDLFLILSDQDHMPIDQLMIITRLFNATRANHAGLCLIQNHDDRLATLAYDLGATDVLPFDISDAELISTINSQFRQSCSLRHIESMMQTGLREALIDPLTGLHNRRSIMARLEHHREQSILNGNPLSLLIMDLDHFKFINDRYGHPAGDFILSKIAQLIKSAISPDHLLARIGGEEFLCVLPNISLTQAKTIADQICMTLSSTSIKLPEGPIVNIRLSIGIDSRCYRANDEVGIKEALALADQALFQAKRAGRARHHSSKTSA